MMRTAILGATVIALFVSAVTYYESHSPYLAAFVGAMAWVLVVVAMGDNRQ